MAKVILEPIGEARDAGLSGDAWSRQVEQMRRLGDELQAKRDRVREGWGPDYV